MGTPAESPTWDEVPHSDCHLGQLLMCYILSFKTGLTFPVFFSCAKREVRTEAGRASRMLLCRPQAGLGSVVPLQGSSVCGVFQGQENPETLTPENGVGGSLWG